MICLNNRVLMLNRRIMGRFIILLRRWSLILAIIISRRIIRISKKTHPHEDVISKRV